jgi:hypothetical protein
LLACDAEGQPVSLEEPGKRERFGRYRRDLCHGAVTFADILEKEGLYPAVDRLHYFSHWVTPEALPIRYDVRFFLALAPPDQEASHDGIELVEHRWIAPRRALDLYEAGRFAMVLPTLMTMAELARFDRVEDVIRFVPGNRVPRILTRMERRGGRFVEIMPDGTRHAVLP